MCPAAYSRFFTWINSLSLMAFGGRTPIIPTLQMRKLRPREVRRPVMFIGLITGRVRT